MTLNDVILRHGGEAQAGGDSFAALNPVQQDALITFLNSQVLSCPTIRRRTSIREIPLPAVRARQHQAYGTV
jgi:hypothetical protein